MDATAEPAAAPPSVGRLAGRVALITGAARGQGAAEAARFVAEGAAVVLGDVLADEVRAVADRLGDAATAVDLDVTDPAAWREAVAVAEARFGGLDVMVNNAGIGSAGAGPTNVADLAIDEWTTVLDVNLTGNLHGIQATAPSIRHRAQARRDHGDPDATGSIVNVSSAQAFLPTPGNAAYAASKWGQRGLTRVAALDLAPLVRVNSVHPGPIDTPMLEPARRSGVLDALAARIPLARIGRPDDVVGLVLFLASDESAFCTGAEFPVDGGRLAGG